jgi:hypothetical protein
VTPEPQPPARPAFPREFPLANGTGAVAIAASRHLDAPTVGSHIDLFLGPEDAAARDPDARAARAYRLPLAAFAANSPRAGVYDAVELELHRAEYLALGTARQLSDGRGRVEPLMQAIGRATVRDDGFEVRWNEWTARGTRIDVSRWRIELSPTEPS